MYNIAYLLHIEHAAYATMCHAALPLFNFYLMMTLAIFLNALIKIMNLTDLG